MNKCVKTRIVSVGKDTAIIDILLLPPLYAKAYQDSVHPGLFTSPIGISEFSKIIEENGEFWYRYNLSSLKANTTYKFDVNVKIYLGEGKDCLQLYPTNYKGEKGSYSISPENNTFTTPPDLSPVDLGLSVLWSSTDWGGSTGSKPTIVPYCWSINPISGLPPYKNISGTDEDPVTAVMGDGWRMPTTAEMQELIDKCDWSTWYNYIISTGEITNYYKKINGKGAYSESSIELYPYQNRQDKNFIGTYWTANVADEITATDQFKINCLFFDDSGQRIQAMPYSTTPTYLIRPVKDK